MRDHLCVVPSVEVRVVWNEACVRSEFAVRQGSERLYRDVKRRTVKFSGVVGVNREIVRSELVIHRSREGLRVAFQSPMRTSGVSVALASAASLMSSLVVSEVCLWGKWIPAKIRSVFIYRRETARRRESCFLVQFRRGKREFRISKAVADRTLLVKVAA